MSVKVLAVSAALLAAGCVSSAYEEAESPASPQCPREARGAPAAQVDESTDEPRDPAMLAVRGATTQPILVRAEGKYITGPGVSLGRYQEDGHRVVRGMIGGSVTELRVEGDQVKGAIDNSPVELSVVRFDTAMNAHGLIGGKLSRFRVDQDGMRGLIGGCAYDLSRVDGGFSGRRTCSQTAENFRLELPDTMASWSDADVAAVMVLFLRKM